jgi:hypothetical protein
MDLRFHPRTKKQKDLRFVPREWGCGYPGYVPPEPPPPKLEPPWSLLQNQLLMGGRRRAKAASFGHLYGSHVTVAPAPGGGVSVGTVMHNCTVQNGLKGIPLGAITQFWGAGVVSSPLIEPEPLPPRPPDAIWEEGPGSIFD